MKHDVAIAESSVELSPNVKGKLIDEILELLRRVEEKSNVTLLRGSFVLLLRYICLLLMYSIKS